MQWLQIFSNSVRGEWQFIKKDRIERILLFWFPALLILFMWNIFSAAQVQNIPIGVLDKDNSQMSRKLISLVDAAPSVVVTNKYTDELEMQRGITSRNEYAALVIPKDFGKKIQRLEQSPVILKVNAQYGTHSGAVKYGVGTAVKTMSVGVAINIVEKASGSAQHAKTTVLPVLVQNQQAFAQTTNYQRILANNIIPAILHILAAIIAVGVFGRHIRDNTLQQWYNHVTAFAKQKPSFSHVMAAVLGKLALPCIALSFWMMVALLLIAGQNNTAFADLLLTVFGSIVFLIFSVLLGAVLVLKTQDMQKGVSAVGVITAPAFAYSGLTYPIVSMSSGAQLIAHALPLTHYLRFQTDHMQASAGWQSDFFFVHIASVVVVVMCCLTAKLAQKALQQTNSGASHAK